MDENNALATTDQTPPGVLAPGTGLEGFEIKPAPLELVQYTTQDTEATPGKFRDKLTGQHFDTIQVVPLSIYTTRVLFPPGADFGADPLCRSNNGIVPTQDAAVPQSDKCATCPQGPKMWARYKETGQKPNCQEKARLVFVLRDTGLPYVMTVGGVSLKSIKNLKTAIARDAAAEQAKGTPRSLFDYTFELRVQGPIVGKKGKYFVLTYGNLRKVASPGEFGPLYEKYILRQRAQDEAVEAEEALDTAIDAEIVSGSEGVTV